MAISGLSYYQIIRYKDLKVGGTYKYSRNNGIMPDNMLISSIGISPTADTTTGTYTFIGPSTPYPDDNQCVTADMFGENPITSCTVNINITMYGNVYLSGITNSELSAITNSMGSKYIIPGGTTSFNVPNYIATWSATSNNSRQYIFALSGGTNTHEPFLTYSQLNKVNLNNYNRFRLSHLNEAFFDDISGVFINNADAFKIGTIPVDSPRHLTVTYSDASPYVSISNLIFLKQRIGFSTASTIYDTPGISTGATNTFGTSVSMDCTMPVGSSPLLELNNQYLYGVACDKVITSDIKTLSNQHFTRNIDLTLISPIFYIGTSYLIK